MKPRKDLNMESESVLVVFELTSGHIVRICDWEAEEGYGDGPPVVEVFDNEEDFSYDDNPRVSIEAQKGKPAKAETFSKE